MLTTEQVYKKIADNINKIIELQTENTELLWNEAIEQAAKAPFNPVMIDGEIRATIRKLKK